VARGPPRRAARLGVIYTLTVAATIEVADFLASRGFQVAAYSGRTDDAERRVAEQDLLDNRVKALVATSALGMGFDKPDWVSSSISGAPSSPIAYYQQVGRAGRSVARAEVILLPCAEDREIWRYFASVGFPENGRVQEVLAALASADAPLSIYAIEGTRSRSRGPSRAAAQDPRRGRRGSSGPRRLGDHGCGVVA